MINLTYRNKEAPKYISRRHGTNSSTLIAGSVTYRNKKHEYIDRSMSGRPYAAASMLFCHAMLACLCSLAIALATDRARIRVCASLSSCEWFHSSDMF